MDKGQFFKMLDEYYNPSTLYKKSVDDMTDWFDTVFHRGQNTYHQSQDPNWKSYKSEPTVEDEQAESSTVETKTESTASTSASPFSDDITEGEYVTFTYNPGDTFGQKIVDLGLATDNGLWGQDGDVNFYTRQLIDQDALDANGNVKLGQTFKLRKRK